MTNEFIISLADTRASLSQVGGKGASLARMAGAGLPVPDGFYLTTAAYDRFVADNNLLPGIRAALKSVDTTQPDTLETASQAIYELFKQAHIPAEIVDAAARAYAKLPGDAPAVAVRSSATAEDLPDHSFAGQQETYLNIQTVDALLEAVKRCWASLWTARAIGYRMRNKIDQEAVSLAVVVQLLVPAEAAGILFTANPVTGQRDQVMISATWGLGEAIVGGLVTPDTLTVDKTTGQILSRDIADKEVMTVRISGGTEEQAVPENLRKAPVLDDQVTTALVEIGSRIEELYRQPMDIEWTLTGGKIDIVQARPITALPTPIEWTMPDPKSRYMRTSIVDLMPDPLSPLFATLGLSVINQGIYRMWVDVFNTKDDMIGNLLMTINGYAYEHLHWSGFELLKMVVCMVPRIPYMMREGVNYWQTVALPPYREAVTEWEDKQPSDMSASELLEGINQVMAAFSFHLGSLMASTMGPSSGSEGLFTMVYKKMVQKPGDPEAPAFLMGFDSAPLRSEKALYDLAIWCREQDGLAAYLASTPAGQIAKQYSGTQTPEGVSDANWREWHERFGDYLNRHGYGIYDMDFMKPLPMDQPALLLETLKLFISKQGTNPYERQRDFVGRREQAMKLAEERVRRGFKRWAYEKALKWAQKQAPLREDGIAEIGLGYPVVRQMLHELGRRFAVGGMIAQAEDIFWLEQDEVEQAVSQLESGDTLADLHQAVEERKAFWQAAKKVAPPPQLPQSEKYLGLNTDLFLAHGEHSGDTIKGVGASPGVVTAPACVLHGPEEFSKMQPGDVLVAGITTPAWTPLFTMASAVVTDIGGPLSHGSIVAREYGIPAVLGTGVATKLIRSGQTITVDGGAGEVIVSDSDSH